MKTLFTPPSFWYQRSSPLSKALFPFSRLYEGVCSLKYRLQTTQHLPSKVICVGNLTLGGSGKTPTVMALARILTTHFKKHPHILSRGYGSRVIGVHRVGPHDTPEYVGDEPLLLSKQAVTWVGADRYDSGTKAIKQGADILIMDDGLQNPSLHHDLKLLVVDGEQGFGNGCVFPAGPLRVSLDKGMKDVDALILIHPNDLIVEKLTSYNKPLFEARFDTQLPLVPQPVLGFSGIGYPKKFRTYLEKQGFEVVDFIPFPDHHIYITEDLRFLQKRQKDLKVPLITTEKDLIKIPLSYRQNTYVLPITLVLKDDVKFHEFLEDTLKLDSLV